MGVYHDDLSPYDEDLELESVFVGVLNSADFRARTSTHLAGNFHT